MNNFNEQTTLLDDCSVKNWKLEMENKQYFENRQKQLFLRLKKGEQNGSYTNDKRPERPKWKNSNMPISNL